MDVHFKLTPEAAAVAKASDKRHILDLLSHQFARAYSLDAATVLDVLEERERLGSTGFGRGVALPHARISGIRRPVAALLKLAGPVDFAAADDLPVDLVVGLLSPVNAGATHLHALAALSRMLRDETVQAALTQAEDAETLYAVVANARSDAWDRDAA